MLITFSQNEFMGFDSGGTEDTPGPSRVYDLYSYRPPRLRGYLLACCHFFIIIFLFSFFYSVELPLRISGGIAPARAEGRQQIIEILFKTAVKQFIL